ALLLRLLEQRRDSARRPRLAVFEWTVLSGAFRSLADRVLHDAPGVLRLLWRTSRFGRCPRQDRNPHTSRKSAHHDTAAGCPGGLRGRSWVCGDASLALVSKLPRGPSTQSRFGPTLPARNSGGHVAFLARRGIRDWLGLVLIPSDIWQGPFGRR